MLKIGICLPILTTPENFKNSHVDPPKILIGDLWPFALVIKK